VQRVYGAGVDAAVSGLAGSEQVITDGKQNVRPGAKVRLASGLNKGSDSGADSKAVHVAAKG
jgi:hypothetical protein